MKLRYSLIALAVLLALVIAALVVFREEPPAQMEASFPDIAADHVTRVRIRNPVEGEDGDEGRFHEVTLVKQGEGEDATWRLVEPVEYPAYEPYVETVLTRLEEMELADVAVENKANWEALEVDDDQAVHVEVWTGDAAAAEFWIGAYKTGHTMLRLPGDERVFKVPGSIRYVFGKRVRDWREKTILDEQAKDVTRVTYRTGEETWTFERRDDEWTQVLDEGEEPLEELEPRRVQSLVGSAARLRAADFADDVEPSEAGLAPPRAEVVLTVTTPAEEAGADASTDAAVGDAAAPEPTVSTHRILVGDERDDEHTHVMVEGNPQVFLVTGHVAQRLVPEADSFQKPPEPQDPPPSPQAVSPPSGSGEGIPPEVMKQVQAEIKKQKMMKKLKEKLAKQK
jgi:hypothetical protein